MAIDIVYKTRVLPGMAIGYPQITDVEWDVECFNRFYKTLADHAEKYARTCRETDGCSFYRMHCTVREDATQSVLSITVSLFHRTPSHHALHRDLCQVWRGGLLFSNTISLL